MINTVSVIALVLEFYEFILTALDWLVHSFKILTKYLLYLHFSATSKFIHCLMLQIYLSSWSDPVPWSKDGGKWLLFRNIEIHCRLNFVLQRGWGDVPHITFLANSLFSEVTKLSKKPLLSYLQASMCRTLFLKEIWI